MAKQSKTYQRVPDPARKARFQAAAREQRRRRMLRRAGLPAAALAVAAVATAVALSLSRHPAATPPKPVSTVAQNAKACLLSDRGQQQADAAFAGLQDAARRLGNINAQQATLPAASTDAGPYVAGLVQQHCDVIVALGPLSVMAAEAAAENTRSRPVAFIAIADGARPAKHLSVLPLAGLTTARVSGSVADALKSHR